MTGEYLIIEDDIEIADIIRKALEKSDFRGDHVCSGLVGLETFKLKRYDFVILDLMLPGLDGLEVLKQLRVLSSDVPILIVSSISNIDKRIEGLRTGADEYIQKPFSTAELTIRVKNIFKFTKQKREAAVISFGDLRLDRLSRAAFQNGTKVDLVKREFQLLDLFVSNPNLVISKYQILKDIFQYNFDPTTNVVDVMICRLRGKLKISSEVVLITVRNCGYMMQQRTFAEKAKIRDE